MSSRVLSFPERSVQAAVGGMSSRVTRQRRASLSLVAARLTETDMAESQMRAIAIAEQVERDLVRGRLRTATPVASVGEAWQSLCTAVWTRLGGPKRRMR